MTTEITLVNPSSAGSEPLSALSMTSRQSLGLGMHMPSPVSPPSRANSYGSATSPGPAVLLRRGSHPLATSHTLGSASAGSSISSLASIHGEEQDAALGEMARSMFRLWRAGRPGGAEDEFLAFVARALGR